MLQKLHSRVKSMLKVLSGKFESTLQKPHPVWVRKKMLSNFDVRVRPEWLDNDIVREELLDVDEIVEINGLSLTKKNGRQIPINWVSQVSKQFIWATRGIDDLFVNCQHVGWNVYKYFYMWSEKYNKDIYMLMNGNGALMVDMQMSGIYLNNCQSFKNNDELVDLIYNYRPTMLGSQVENGYLNGTFLEEWTGSDSERFGYPLKKGEQYKIFIGDNWKLPERLKGK